MAEPIKSLRGQPLQTEDITAGLEYFKFLVFGYSGVGKTRLVASAADIPEMSPVLYLNADVGQRSIANRSQIKQVRVYGVETMERVLNWLKANKGVYKTVILDSLTALNNNYMLEYLQSPDRSGDRYVPGWDEYKYVAFRIRQHLQILKLQPVNFLATAMVAERAEDEDNRTAPKVLLPGLTGKLAVEVCGEFDIVGYMYTAVQQRQVFRYVQFQPYGRRNAKARAMPGHELPPVMKEPTLKAIYNLVMKGIKTPTEEDIDLMPYDESLADSHGNGGEEKKEGNGTAK